MLTDKQKQERIKGIGEVKMSNDKTQLKNALRLLISHKESVEIALEHVRQARLKYNLIEQKAANLLGGGPVEFEGYVFDFTVDYPDTLPGENLEIMKLIDLQTNQEAKDSRSNRIDKLTQE